MPIIYTVHKEYSLIYLQVCALLLCLLIACSAPEGDSEQDAANSAETALLEQTTKTDALEQGVERQDLPLPSWRVPTEQIDRAAMRSVLNKAQKDLQLGRLIRTAEQDQDGALEGFLKILAIDPNSKVALKGRDESLAALSSQAKAELALGQTALAREAVHIFRNVNPQHTEMEGLLGNLYDADKASDAKVLGDTLAKKGSRFAPAQKNAYEAYLQALKIFPDYAPAKQSIDAILQVEIATIINAVEQGDYSQAERKLVKLNAAMPNTAEVQNLRAQTNQLRLDIANAAISQANDAMDRLELRTANDALEKARLAAPQISGFADALERLELTRIYGHFRPLQIFTEVLVNGDDGPSMVVIPVGRFMMGSQRGTPGHQSYEAPIHPVVFRRGFAIAQTEITVADFKKFVKASDYRTVAEIKGRSTVYDEKGGVMSEHRGADWRRDYAGKRVRDDQLPVTHIAFADAQAYARWLSEQTGHRYRLPTEAEFEYVQRAGTTSNYPWGDQTPDKLVANLTGAGDRSPKGRQWGNPIEDYADQHWGPAPVGSFPQERFKTYDMTGNLSEWVQDCWHDGYQRAPSDGRAWVNPGCADRVVRGGSWASSLEQARSAYRLSVPADTVNTRVGFRVVREL